MLNIVFVQQRGGQLRVAGGKGSDQREGFFFRALDVGFGDCGGAGHHLDSGEKNGGQFFHKRWIPPWKFSAQGLRFVSRLQR